MITNESEPAAEEKKGRGRRKAFSPVGLLDGNRNTLHGIIDIAVFNSALSEDGVKPFVRNYGMVIADECHHSGAIGYEQVLKYVNARYVYGLSATPTRQDGMTPIVSCSIANVIQIKEIIFFDVEQNARLINILQSVKKLLILTDERNTVKNDGTIRQT